MDKTTADPSRSKIEMDGPFMTDSKNSNDRLNAPTISLAGRAMIKLVLRPNL